MSLHIRIGHSGQTVLVDQSTLTSLDALRAVLTEKTNVPAQRQVLLTPSGKSVRSQTYHLESELFLFDSALSSSSATTQDSRILAQSRPRPHVVSRPPDTIASQTDLQSWKNLFSNRLDWALRLRDFSTSLGVDIASHIQERSTIIRALHVAVHSLHTHIKGAEQKQAAAESWVNVLVQEQSPRLGSWTKDFKILAQIPAKPAFAHYLQSSSSSRPVRQAQQPESVTLQSFLHEADVASAAKSAATSVDSSLARVENARAIIASVSADCESLLNDTTQLSAQSDQDLQRQIDLSQETDIILNKLRADHDLVTNLPANTHSVSKASKMALVHTRDHLPHMQQYVQQSSTLAQTVLDQRNDTARAALQYMQVLSANQSRLSRAYTVLKSLELPADEQYALGLLNLVSRLPFGYGSWMIESLRRQQLTQSSIDIDEQKRRKTWLASVDDVIDPASMADGMPRLEAGLDLPLADVPPNVELTQTDLQDYLDVLSSLCFPQDVIDGLVSASKALDQTTGRHSRTSNRGSIHEAEFGPPAPSITKPAEEVEGLRSANAKLQNELRAQKSRVRKLEDLLHRQTALNGSSTADVFVPRMDLVSSPQTPPTTASSPVPSFRISQDMTAHFFDRPRRSSSRQQNEEKSLVRRLVTLEGELDTARQKIVSLERNASENQQAQELGRLQLQDAQSTKLDIMHNMEAQQREFALVRRTLENDLNQARSRIEDAEDELDRLLGSRDNEKNTIDAQSRAFENKIERLKAEHNVALSSKDEQLKDVQNKYEAAFQRTQAQIDELRHSVAAAEASEREYAVTLVAAHSQLSPDTEPPTKYTDLVSAIGALVDRSTLHASELANAVTMAKAENESLTSQLQIRQDEISNQRIEANDEIARAHEQEAIERAQAQHLQTLLDDERKQLRNLREQFADGETGADSLRRQVTEAEDRARQVDRELSQTKSHLHNLEAETGRLRGIADQAAMALTKANQRLEKRGVRSKEVSQRLYSYNTRLLRLLESLGFAVSHRNGEMMIERASKVGTSTSLTDLSSSLQRTVSLSSPPATRKPSQSDSLTNLASLDWPETKSLDDGEEDNLYETFINHVSTFSINAFSEAIAKRIRDFEYTARKWQKEAKNNKDKSLRFQKDSHAKIAVRDFKEGDLALFLPTKGKAVGAWAAFNINAPHHFLYEKEGMTLGRREWLVARVTKIERRAVVDTTDATNPFGLSQGLTWFLVHAAEDKIGAPTTPGLGKSTVAAANVDATGSNVVRNTAKGKDAFAQYKSLESRRSSTASRLSAKGVAPSLERASSPSGLGLVVTLDRVTAPPRNEIDTAAAVVSDDDVVNRPRLDQSSSAPLPNPALLDDNVSSLSAAAPDTNSGQVVSLHSKPGSRAGPVAGGWQSLWSLDYEIEGPRRKT